MFYQHFPALPPSFPVDLLREVQIAGEERRNVINLVFTFHPSSGHSQFPSLPAWPERTYQIPDKWAPKLSLCLKNSPPEVITSFCFADVIKGWRPRRTVSRAVGKLMLVQQSSGGQMKICLFSWCLYVQRLHYCGCFEWIFVFFRFSQSTLLYSIESAEIWKLCLAQP